MKKKDFFKILTRSAPLNSVNKWLIGTLVKISVIFRLNMTPPSTLRIMILYTGVNLGEILFFGRSFNLTFRIRGLKVTYTYIERSERILLCEMNKDINTHLEKCDRANDRPKLEMLAIVIGSMSDRGPKIAPDYKPRITARVKPATFQIYNDINNDNKI